MSDDSDILTLMGADSHNQSRYGVQERAIEVDSSIPAKSLRWSASSVTTFVQCPLKLWWGKVAGWQEGPSTATAAGTAVHSALEHLFERDPAERTPPVAEAALAVAIDEVRDELAAAAVPIDDVRERAEAALAVYWNLEDPVAVDVLPGGLEREISLELAGVTFIGYADRVARSDTGAIVSDYKTGVAKPRYLGPYYRQQYLYAAALHEEDVDVTEIELLFLGEGRRIRRPVYPAALERATATLRATADEAALMADTGHWTARQSGLCGWCSFETVCPLRRSRVPIPGSVASNERLAVIPGMAHRASTPKVDEVAETAIPPVVGDLDPADEAPADGGLFG